MSGKYGWTILCLLLLPAPAQAQGAGEGPAWWLSFNDDTLTELIESALAANDQLAAARQREQAAQAQADQRRAPLLPSLSLEANGSASPSDSLGFQMGGLPSLPGGSGPTMPEVVYSGSAKLQLHYQVDLAGERILAWRAQRHQTEAAGHDVDTTALVVSFRVADAYFDALMAQQQIDLINRQVQTQRELLALLQLRFDHGTASAAEVWQQRQQLAAAEANLPEAEAASRQARHQLALQLALPGGYRADQPALQLSATPLPRPPPLPPGPVHALAEQASLQQELGQRPDLQAARARLAAAQAQRRSSIRAFAPRLGLSLYGGGQAFRSDEWSTQPTWGAAVDLSVPLFRGLSELAGWRAARAQEAEARHLLAEASREALSDLGRAWEAEQEARAQLQARQRVVTAARQAFEAAQSSFAAGIGNYLTVMTTLTAWQQAEQAVLQAQRNLLRGRTRLHQALGGAWPSHWLASGEEDSQS